MAVETLELQVNVTGVAQGSAQLDRLTRSAQQSVNVLGFLRNALVLASSIRLFSGFFEMIDGFQRMQQQLQLVTGSLDDTGAAMQVVFRIAQDARSPLEAVNTLFQRLVRVGGNLGYTYGQVSTITKAVAQSFTIAGASADETKNAIVQLTQGLNLGTLRGQDLKSVVEFNPVIAEAFADKLYQLGLSTDAYGNKIKLAGGQLYAFVTAHKNILTTKIALDAITEAAAKWNEQIQKTPPTLGQLLTNAKNTFTYIIGTLGQTSGLFAGLNNVLLTINQNLGAIIGTALALGAAFASWLVLEFITVQFAKMFAFRGLFGLMLAPVRNLGLAFVNLYTTLVNVAGIIGRVGRGLYDAALGAAAFVGNVARLAAGGLVAWFRLVDAGLNAFANGISFAINAVFSFGSATTSVLSRIPGFLALVIQNAGELAVLLGRDLVSAASRFGTALVGGLASVAVSALSAIPAIFVTLLALVPLLLTAVAGLTVAFGGLVSLGAGLTGLGDTISGVAAKTSSWHDILNSFIKFALVAFDVLANHLPLVFAVIGEQWNNLVAGFTNGVVKLYSAFDTYLVSPLLQVLRIVTILMPLLGTLAGAGVGAVVGGPVGALIGGFAGLAGGTIAGVKFADIYNSVSEGWQDVGERARQVAAEAGKKSGTTYTDELTRVISESMQKYGKGDFIKALNLLGQGIDLKTVAQQTGVAIGDLTKVQSVAGFLGKTVPQRGQINEGTSESDKLIQRRLQDIASIQNFVKQVEPYAAGLAKMAEAEKLFARAKKDGVDVDKLLAESGLTRAELMKRLSREVVGAGNEYTDFVGRVKLLDEALKANNITVQEYAEQWNKARIKFLSAQTDLSSGVELAVRKMTQTLSDQGQIAEQTVTSALANQQALARVVVQVDALREAYSRGILTTKQFQESLRDVQITALETQTDLASGFERGLLKLQRSFADTASAAEAVMTNAFNGISDQLTELLTGGKVDLASFSQSVFKSFANVLSREAVGSLLNSITDNGTNGNVLGKVANQLGLGGALGSSTANPMYVTLADSNILGNSADLLSNTFDIGGAKLRGSIYEGMQQGTNSFGDVISRFFGGSAGGPGSSGGLLNGLLGGGASGGGGFLSGIFGGGGASSGGGGFLSSLLGGVTGLLGFATEGQFTVGGTGGMDSQIVPIRATPGEVVSVTHGHPTEAQADAAHRTARPNIINMTVQTNDVHSFNRSQAQVFGRLRRGISAAGRNA